ncbi:MAG: hypothetical protein ACRD3N_06115 [Terracidiphilus sp.]
MTLLDAPKFNEARYRRNRLILFSAAGLIFTLFVAWWLVAGHPVDWPWNWNNYIFGNATVDTFFNAVEQNDMNKAYGIWFHDPNWQQHPGKYSSYTVKLFEQDWSPASSQNTYGPIRSDKIAGERMNGNVLIVGLYINGQTKNPVFLAYDPHHHTLSFSPVQLQLGPMLGLGQ